MTGVKGARRRGIALDAGTAEAYVSSDNHVEERVMKPVLRKVLLSGLILVVPLLAACSSGDANGHSVSLGGMGHRDGYANPLGICTECHGATLRGGKGPSCYACHNSSDHQTVRAGVRHNQPGIDCARCHGPSRTRGGLGPACVQGGCHAA